MSSSGELHRPHSLGLPAAVLAVVVLATGPLSVRTIGAPTVPIVFWRLWLVQPITIGAVYATGGRLSLTILRRAAVPGAMFALAIMCGFASFTRTSIANASLIPALLPAVIMVVAARLFDERPSRRQYVYAAGALAGMAVVVLGAGKTSGAHLSGDLLALVNLALYSMYFIRVKRIRDEGISAPLLIAAVFLASAVVFTPWAVLTAHNLAPFDAHGWTFVVVLAIVSTTGHLALTWAQRHLSLTIASLLTLAMPVVSSLLAWLIEHEQLAPVQALGAVLAVASLVALVTNMRSSAPAVTRDASVGALGDR